MPDTNAFAEVVSALTRKTDNGLIEWEKYDPNKIEDIPSPDEAGQGFRARIQGMELRVFKYHERQEPPESPRVDSDAPAPAMEEKTILMLRNTETNQQWIFPEMGITDDLHASAHRESVGVQKWIHKVLQDEA